MTERPLRLVLPHQLFEDHLEAPAGTTFVLVEHDLLFRQYRFHRQKLVLHRASMRRFAGRLRERGFDVEHVETDAATTSRAALADVVRRLAPTGRHRARRRRRLAGPRPRGRAGQRGARADPRGRPGVAGLPHQPRRAGRPLHRAARRWRSPPDAALLRLAAAPPRRPGHRGRRPGGRALVLRRGQPQEAAAPPPGARPRRARATRGGGPRDRVGRPGVPREPRSGRHLRLADLARRGGGGVRGVPGRAVPRVRSLRGRPERRAPLRLPLHAHPWPERRADLPPARPAPGAGDR